MPAKTMKAAVVRTFHEPRTIEALPAPAPQWGEVLAKIAASGVCHADLHAAGDDWPVKPSLPFVPGREGVGVVAAVAVWAHMYSDDAGLM
jgi:propanol-preferring alcohol dehydrogenase